MQYGQEGLNATVLPTHTIMEIKNYYKNFIMHMWAVPRDSPLLHDDLENAKLLFYEYFSVLLYKYMF